MTQTDRFNRMEEGFDMGLAADEAARCLLCHDAPCSKGCPAGTDPGAFIRKLRFRNITGAIRTIKQNNILGGACGVLCPTHRLCEKECSATGIDRPIRIGEIQRCLVEHSWRTGFFPLEKVEPNGKKAAVIGSGPAGLSCAAHLARDGFAVTVFEACSEPGGVLRWGVVPFRFDVRFLEKELEDVRRLGVEIQCNTRIEGPGGAEKLLADGFDAVFIGTGLWGAARLDENAGELDGLYSSVDFLASLRGDKLSETEGRVRDKTVAVIGGGSVAMDCVMAATRLGARDVYLLYRRSYAQMPAEEDELHAAEKAGVHFVLLNQPVGFMDDGGRVTGVRLVRTRLGEPDDSGRRRPEAVEDSEWELEADVVVEAIGNTAEKDSPEWYPNVKLNEKNLIQVDPETNRTSVEGLFAGGDAVRGPALVVWAVQDGKNAARAMAAFLGRKGGEK